MNGVTCGWQTDPKIPRSAFWALIGAMIGGIGTFGSVLAFLTAMGACGTNSDSTEFRACSALAALLGGPGGAAGYVWGYCIARLSRLQPNRGRRCISGLVLRISRMQFSGGVALAAFTYDPDWTFDVAPRTDQATDLVSRDALWIRCFTLTLDCKDHPQDPAGTPTIHCEIPSRIGEWGCIGGSIGAAVGAALGIAVVIALAPLAAACGPLAFLCLLLILLLGALITYAGAEVGAIIGHRIGEALDANQELASAYGEALCGSCLSVEGDWVTDQDHGHNEIHDVEAIPLLVHPPPGELFRFPDACPDGCPGVEFILRIFPEVIVINQGGSADYTVEVSPLGAFSQAVSVVVESGLPPEATPQLSPGTPQVLPATFALNITTTPTIPINNYTFVVRATANGQSRAISARLDVIPVIF